jgi:cytochrome c553
MKKLTWFLLGAITLFASEVLAVSVVAARAHGWSAREEPTAIERWVARRVRDAAFSPTAMNQANPMPRTKEVLDDARAHWADHCASCHANDGSGDIALGKRDAESGLAMALSGGLDFRITRRVSFRGFLTCSEAYVGSSALPRQRVNTLGWSGGILFH